MLLMYREGFMVGEKGDGCWWVLVEELSKTSRQGGK